MIYIASFHGRHSTFEAFGQTRAQAVDALAELLNSLSPRDKTREGYKREYIEWRVVVLGGVYVDGQRTLPNGKQLMDVLLDHAEENQ